MEYRYQFGDEMKTVRVERSGDDYLVAVGDHRYTVRVDLAQPGELRFTCDGQPCLTYVASDGPRRYVAFDAVVYTLSQAEPTSHRKRSTGSAENNLTASMHGQVVNVLVSEGDGVTRGQPLLLLEAMKMEIRITAPHDGRVARILCSAGQIVERGQTLIELASG
jgi:biotin carboxyl carrier protein